MKKPLVMAVALTLLGTASSVAIASSAIFGGGGSITTRNAQNGTFTIPGAGASVNISGCNGAGHSNCITRNAQGGAVAKGICDMANDLGLGKATPINLATPCGKNPEGPVTVGDCCEMKGPTTGPNGAPGGWAPLPNNPGNANDNKCIVSPEEVAALKKKGKCNPDPEPKSKSTSRSSGTVLPDYSSAYPDDQLF